MTITADFAAGSSGAPILSSEGNVVGVVCSTYSIYYDEAESGDPTNLQMVIKYCVPLPVIHEFIQTATRGYHNRQSKASEHNEAITPE